MNRQAFDQEYGYVFTSSPVIQYLKSEGRAPLANCIIDIAAYIENKYDGDVAYRAKAYTPHDFKHHILNVIKIAGDLLKRNLSDFSTEDLFCFLLACILHDIGMVFYADQNRFYHSFVAAKMVCEEILSLESAPNQMYKEIICLANSNKPELDNPEVIDNFKKELQGLLNNYSTSIGNLQKRKIAVMILGHSDLKFPTPKKTFDTLHNDLFSGWGFHPCSAVHILAAFLRWADELDLSSTRCQGIRREELLADSMPFWNKLKLVDSVSITPAKITLYINRPVYKANQEESYIYLKEIIEKLNKERITCRRVFEQYEKPQYQFPEITNESIDPTDIQSLFMQHASDSTSESSTDSIQNLPPNDQLDIPALVQAIKICIDERHLCKEGHYCIHTENEMGKGNAFCIRNLLDCNGLLSRHDLFDDIAQALLSKIPKNAEGSLSDYILIGIANSGALLAAHMAAMSGLPFASWVPNNKCVQYTPQEKDLEYLKQEHPDKKSILVIGVNYTGKAISDAFDLIDNVEFVVGLINRDIQRDNCLTAQLFKKKRLNHYFLIEDYPIEKCQYSPEESCPYYKICEQRTFYQE